MAVKAKGLEIPPELLDSLLAKVPDEAERARLSENRGHLSVGYYLVPNKKKTKLGATRRGGPPDLPSQISWPESDGGLLPFLLQLDLPTALPASSSGCPQTAGSISSNPNLQSPKTGLVASLFTRPDEPRRSAFDSST